MWYDGFPTQIVLFCNSSDYDPTEYIGTIDGPAGNFSNKICCNNLLSVLCVDCQGMKWNSLLHMLGT